MLIGILIGLGLQAVTSAIFVALIAVSGHEFKLDDTGADIFDKVDAIVQWSGERAQAIQAGAPLPDPPRIFADLTSIKFGFATTAVLDVTLIAMVAILVKAADQKALLRTFKMERYSFDDLWLPGLMVIAMYLFTIGYQLAVRALGIEFLEPRSTVPQQITRDTFALAAAGVLGCIAAPIAEEFFFRGLIVTGLLKWGFIPATAVSASLFTLAHLDIGSIIPFFTIGVVLSWLYWRRGCLWDSIAFHFLFNSTSFVFLVLQR